MNGARASSSGIDVAETYVRAVLFDTALNEIASVESARDEHVLDPDSVVEAHRRHARPPARRGGRLARRGARRRCRAARARAGAARRLGRRAALDVADRSSWTTCANASACRS